MKEKHVVAIDAEPLGQALARAGESADAVANGRVFVEGRRARDPGAMVAKGARIVVAPPRPAAPGSQLLAEWQGLYAAYKPPGVPTEPDRRSNASLLFDVARELGVGARELHAVTRLDLPVSGVVIVARGAAATAHAANLKREGRLRRRYVALVSGRLDVGCGTWNTPIGGGRSQNRGARDAKTGFQVVANAGEPERPTSLIALEPVTGRMHQLRIHASTAGVPMLGDAAYGGPRRVVAADGRVTALDRIALHAARVEVREREKTAWSVLAPHAPDLVEIWMHLGGAADAFDVARAAPWLDAARPACE